MIRILIADDANLIRQALNIYFKLESDLQIVGTAENGKTALELIEELNPDIVLMDMEMPEMDGLTATKIICQRFPETKVIVISSHSSQEDVDKALNAGAKGYFIKSTPADELSEAIKLIYQRDVQIIPTLSPEQSYIVLQDSSPSTNQTKSRSSSLPLVTPHKLLPLLHRWINKRGIIFLSVFGAALFLASVLKYKMTVKANAQISSNSEIVLVQTSIEGKVESIAVKENQKVEVGETIATINASQLQTKKRQLEQSIQQIQQQIIQIDSQINELNQKVVGTASVSRTPISEKRVALQYQKSTLQEHINRDRQQLQQIDNQLQNDRIRAPIAGTIKQIYIRNQQQSVRSGDLIAKISSSQLPLLVKAAVASQDIAKVERDQKVQLKVFDCPDNSSGTLQGKTVAISPEISSAPSKKNLLIPKQPKGQNINFVSDTYEVTIELASLSLDQDQQKCQLESGMKARANIITQEESILALILRKAGLINNL